jgi:hypothetical protein
MSEGTQFAAILARGAAAAIWCEVTGSSMTVSLALVAPIFENRKESTHV